MLGIYSLEKQVWYNELIAGCCEIISMNELIDKLTSKKKLIIKAGFDPTSADLHLGHFLILKKLSQFQMLGHQIVCLIGDFTARIGDPSGNSISRVPISKESIKSNIRFYEEQIFRVLDKDKTKIVYNSEWLNTLSIEDFFILMSKCSVSRMFQREDFRRRYFSKKSILINEFLYPLLQGYDSMVLNADIEIGGIDQKFNLLIGREIQKKYGLMPQCIIMLPLMIGLDGVRKMSKSFNNYIGINESPEEIFGKIMSISDDIMWHYIEVLNLKSLCKSNLFSKTKKISGLDIMNIKVLLAKKLVMFLYSQKDADLAHKVFIDKFRNKLVPKNLIVETILYNKELSIINILRHLNFSRSNSESFRLIKQGAVKIDGKRICDLSIRFFENKIYIIQVGKLRYSKFILKK
ncbi:tyrosine--tRNA ligase [Candidatus Legionella polyplacis]|uniref:tyrosine--tRNA ligase n=1 Tax=Candidatus Legionella polyplacis TaxID=2005262 RepID=UPI000C1E9EEC|nr:tyrosine--tRNA ligase [Candidatus Legionella polyplacis]ATW01971.1 tyrosine--tRNA ligase [Candidatus Legionella polyplacis]